MFSPAQQTTTLRGKIQSRDEDLEGQRQRALSSSNESRVNKNHDEDGRSSLGTDKQEDDKHRQSWSHAIVNYLQTIPVSPRVLRYMRRWKLLDNRQQSSPKSSAGLPADHDRAAIEATDHDDKLDDKSTVYWISGLDHVVFGNQSVAHAVLLLGQYKLLPYLCYMLSGMVCDVLMLLTDLLWHFGFGIRDATTCWLISFVLSIVPRHSALKVMCFGNYVGGYYQSLARMYLGMSASIALSTIGNYCMTKWWGVAHYVAWIVTLLWTGVVNYFVLKKCWRFGGGEQ